MNFVLDSVHQETIEVEGALASARVAPDRMPSPLSQLVVVWRDNGQALITTRKYPDSTERAGAVVWPRGISGYYLGTHCREPQVDPSAVPHLQEAFESPVFAALVGALEQVRRDAQDRTSITLLEAGTMAAVEGALALAERA